MNSYFLSKHKLHKSENKLLYSTALIDELIRSTVVQWSTVQSTDDWQVNMTFTN